MADGKEKQTKKKTKNKKQNEGLGKSESLRTIKT